MKTLSYGVFRMTSSVRPAESLPDASRIQSLDILRGMALLGMIVVHLHDRSTDPGGIGLLDKSRSPKGPAPAAFPVAR